MIGWDSYSKQVFIYLDPILIYISLWIDCLFEIRKIAVFPLAFIAGWLQGHWWGFISRNYVVWPTFLLMNVLIALKGSHFWFFLVLKQETGHNLSQNDCRTYALRTFAPPPPQWKFACKDICPQTYYGVDMRPGVEITSVATQGFLQQIQKSPKLLLGPYIPVAATTR